MIVRPGGDVTLNGDGFLKDADADAVDEESE